MNYSCSVNHNIYSLYSFRLIGGEGILNPNPSQEPEEGLFSAYTSRYFTVVYKTRLRCLNPSCLPLNMTLFSIHQQIFHSCQVVVLDHIILLRYVATETVFQPTFLYAILIFLRIYKKTYNYQRNDFPSEK